MEVVESLRMNRLAAILLILCFAGIGSGALEYWHDLEHDVEDARADAIAKAAGLPVVPHEHDESNCPVHAQLHMPLLTVAWVPLLVCLGLLIAFLTLIEPVYVPQPIPARIDCRGPPIC